jgi:hypothetical protein
MGGGGKAESTPWRGPASAQRPPHGGDYSALGNERAKPLAFPHNQMNGGRQPPLAAARQSNGTLAQTTPAVRPAPGPVGLRASGKESGKSASGSAKQRRTLRSAKRGKECDLRNSRSSSNAPDRHPKGQDQRLGSRKRIERVARRAAHSNRALLFRSPSFGLCLHQSSL